MWSLENGSRVYQWDSREMPPFLLPLYASSTHLGGNDVCKAKYRIGLFCNQRTHLLSVNLLQRNIRHSAAVGREWRQQAVVRTCLEFTSFSVCRRAVLGLPVGSQLIHLHQIEEVWPLLWPSPHDVPGTPRNPQGQSNCGTPGPGIAGFGCGAWYSGVSALPVWLMEDCR